MFEIIILTRPSFTATRGFTWQYDSQRNFTHGIRTVRSDLWRCSKSVSKEAGNTTFLKFSKKASYPPILSSFTGYCAEHDHLRGRKVVQIVDVNLEKII